jgi:trigger factor
MDGSTLTRLAPTRVALEFTITDAELAAAEERAFRRLAKNARLPGFRKGRVPRKLFEQTYGTKAVTGEAVDAVVPEAYAKALREHDLEPVERPEFEILEEAGGRPTRLKATVEVRPEIALGAYRGVVVSRPAFETTDADVDRTIEALAKERATLVPVERPARLGDVATLDYQGAMDGEPFEGGRGDREIAELVEGRFVPGFATGIAGMRPGETKQIEVRFPADYPAPALAGKPAQFTVTLHELKEFELPPIDDDFARQISPEQTLAQLRQDVRTRLEAVATGRARRAAGNAIVTKLLSSHDFALPAPLVERELEALIEELGTAPPGEQRDEDALREANRAQAESRVRAALLMQAIAKAENIVATPGDLSAELDALARRYGQPVARIRKALGSGMLSLADGIVRNKTLDFLIDNAVVSADEETPPGPS